jgi:hypothetical protein
LIGYKFTIDPMCMQHNTLDKNVCQTKYYKRKDCKLTKIVDKFGGGIKPFSK